MPSKIAQGLRCSVVAFTALVLVACVHGGSSAHGIAIQVYGQVPVHDIKIFYGKETISFSGITVPGASSLWNAPMPVPDQMNVTWTVSDKLQQVSIPLKGKLSTTDRLVNWRLRFYGEKVELWRQDADPSSVYYNKPVVLVFP